MWYRFAALSRCCLTLSVRVMIARGGDARRFGLSPFRWVVVSASKQSESANVARKICRSLMDQSLCTSKREGQVSMLGLKDERVFSATGPCTPFCFLESS
ncbi:uncharacterized protein L969DRAFT_50854 [Mixia osmundae IAM 14324]|uniref:Secreted protein n=1 Tax=Mixia osmundae (strain CBS 9802 / IAM 14324 / JCM 22182 / KY 12970) TaxID=764103 RepID=G7E0E0_MIXOS|nr:uncharacterized protein L969DRAFT_50854 [Mixia osmundae IAM 14324]KEI38309.1 hypothetical protein L969DRAFT_50854 [Mixia osmundae IAM 14324]GAA96300.1 hypothetical protein E5Q_02966 [Mixia osmundae IAM 14324]